MTARSAYSSREPPDTSAGTSSLSCTTPVSSCEPSSGIGPAPPPRVPTVRPPLRGSSTSGFWPPRGAADLDQQALADVDHVVSALGVTRQKADPWTIDFALNLRYLELAERSDTASFLYIGVMNAALGTSAVSRAKHAFMEALSRSRVAPQIVNPSGYFSDLTEIYELARRGMAFGLGDGGVRLSPIHGADLADFCVSRIGDAAGTWEVGGPEALTYREIVQLAFEAAGRRPRYTRVPEPLASAAVWTADRMSPRAGSLTRFFLEGMRSDSVGQPHGTRTLGEYFASLR